jgi:uncharacterized protein
MIRDEIIGLLRQHTNDLRGRGVKHVSLFGSVARGDANAESDVDLIVEMSPERPITLLTIGPLHDLFSAILGRPVDVIDKAGLDRTSRLKDRVSGDLLNVF